MRSAGVSVREVSEARNQFLRKRPAAPAVAPLAIQRDVRPRVVGSRAARQRAGLAAEHEIATTDGAGEAASVGVAAGSHGGIQHCDTLQTRSLQLSPPAGQLTPPLGPSAPPA